MLVACLSTAQTQGQFDHVDHFLSTFVNDSGLVDYQAVKSDKEGLLEAAIEQLEAGFPHYADRRERMAYWINVYNVYTIKAVVENYPIKSILDIRNGNLFNLQIIQLADKTYSLNQIEDEILRDKYNDPRIHFALNCAAVSCPPLMNRAWTMSNLEDSLDEQTKAFINDPAHLRITSKQILISKIFEWYADDFGNLRQYLAKYYLGEIPAGLDFEYADYSWDLNDRK